MRLKLSETYLNILTLPCYSHIRASCRVGEDGKAFGTSPRRIESLAVFSSILVLFQEMQRKRRTPANPVMVSEQHVPPCYDLVIVSLLLEILLVKTLKLE